MEAALACTIAQHDEQEIAMIVTASVDFRDEKARAGGRYQSVWRKFVHAVVGPSAPNEGESSSIFIAIGTIYRLKSGLNLSVATSAPKRGL